METGVPIESFSGFKFSPTEKELILYFLRRKIEGFQKGVEAIREIDITKHEPWDLPAQSIIPSNNEWYFFLPRGRKYPNGRQSKRATQYGYWKATGKQRNVKSGNRVVGTKRTLVFHKGQAPNWERTEWIMHEYCRSGTPLESFVVCRVRNCKNSGYKCYDIPPKEMNQSLTEESSTSTVANYLHHTGYDVEHMEMFQGSTSLDGRNNPNLVGCFDSEYDMKPGNIIFQHLAKSFDSEFEYDKKPGDLFFPDESCSSPKGHKSVTDDCFADMFKDDFMMLDESSFANFLGDDYMDFKSEQPAESLPPATLATPTSQETEPAIIKIRSRQKDKPVKPPLPFQGTAPRRIRMKLQHLDKPSAETSSIRGKLYHNVALSAEFPQGFITRILDVTVNHRRLTVLVFLVLLVCCFFLAHKR
ncbi:NAC domain-containing protein 40-like isoform X2 [Apium graveolens]